jgi:hypothetical protein
MKSLIAVLLALFVVPAAANDKKSVYTDLDLGACNAEPTDPDDPLQGGVWWCEGYGGIAVRVSEGDLRFFVSYRNDAAHEIAASETLPAFNTIGKKLEWRLELGSDDGEWLPFATILRFLTDAGEGGVKGQFLVVTKLGEPGQICHVARIDAIANSDANALARQAADEQAPGFICGTDVPSRPGLNRD